MTRGPRPINRSIEQLWAQGNLSTEAISARLGIDRDYTAYVIRCFRTHSERDQPDKPCDGKHIDQVFAAQREGFPDIASFARQRVRA